MNICQNEIKTLPSKTLDKKIVNDNENSTKITEKDLPQRHLNDITATEAPQKNNRAEYHKQWRIKNRQRLKEHHKQYRQSHLEDIVKNDAIYYKTNKKSIRATQLRYRLSNASDIAKTRRLYERNRRKTDLVYKIKCNLRRRLNHALKSNYKSGSAIKDLGCSIEEFKKYIESKFQEGMTWENYGYYTWHIDHIKPLVKFDLTKREQLLEACHYTNLQPLWAKDNRIKNGN